MDENILRYIAKASKLSFNEMLILFAGLSDYCNVSIRFLNKCFIDFNYDGKFNKYGLKPIGIYTGDTDLLKVINIIKKVLKK